jgi:hypothetical protein
MQGFVLQQRRSELHGMSEAYGPSTESALQTFHRAEPSNIVVSSYRVYKILCPNDDTWEDKLQTKANFRSKRKDKRQIASLPTPIYS